MRWPTFSSSLHAFERDPVGLERILRRFNLRGGGLKLGPVRDHLGVNAEPRILHLFLELIVGLLGLADARGDAAALIERHVHAAYDGKDLLLLSVSCSARSAAV